MGGLLCVALKVNYEVVKSAGQSRLQSNPIQPNNRNNLYLNNIRALFYGIVNIHIDFIFKKANNQDA